MHLAFVPLLLSLFPLLSLADLSSSPKSVTIAYLPVSDSSSTTTPTPLAHLQYYPANHDLSSISSFTPPSPETGDETTLLRIGILSPDRNSLRGSTTVTSLAALNFSESISRSKPHGNARFRIWAREGEDEGEEVWGVSFYRDVGVWVEGSRGLAEGKEEKKKGGDKSPEIGVEIVKSVEGPRPILNRPVVLREGKLAEPEPEKTLFQKYWWIILGVAVLAMAGGGEQK